MHIKTLGSLMIVLTPSLAASSPPTDSPRQEQPAGAAVQTAQASAEAKCTVPAWAFDARWYQIDVSAFRGNLESLQLRLPSLIDLGANTLYLTHVFGNRTDGDRDTIDLRHITDSLNVKSAPGGLDGETDDPVTWRLSASDRMFVDFLKAAHGQSIRVVLEMVIPDALPGGDVGPLFETHLLEVSRRWLDPDGNGDASDGIDGWVVRAPELLPRDFWKRWREKVKKINQNALVVCDVGSHPTAWVTGDTFDVAMDHEAADVIRRFLNPSNRTYALAQFIDDLGMIPQRTCRDAVLAAPTRLSGPEIGRLLSALSQRVPAQTDESATGSAQAVADAEARWRIATVLQYFRAGAPVVYGGDENQRDDFASLIKWLNTRRETHEPLRRGDFRPIMSDEGRSAFSFARSLPGDEVVLVVNYGEAKQKVILQVGRPGQLVGVMSPRLDPSPLPPLFRERASQDDAGRIKPLRMGGSRQFVDTGGHIRLWVDPMSIRVVLLKDDAPWELDRKHDSGRKGELPN